MAKSGDGYVLREFTVDDYEQYASWFEDPPQLEDLPPVGLVCDDMKAVGFLYRTDSTFCVLAYWHTNPECKRKEGYKALKKVIMGLCDTAKILKRNNIFITTNIRGMIRLLESLGFYNANGHLILRLQND